MAVKGNIPWNKGLTKETDARVKRNAQNISAALMGKPSTRIKYSMDPDDWYIYCDYCNRKVLYKNRGSYMNAVLRQGKNIKKHCASCQNVGSKRSDETKQKMSIAAKNRKLSDEDRKIRRKKYSAAQKKRYKNMTLAQREELVKKRKQGLKNMDPLVKKNQYKKIKAALIELKANSKYPNTFKPGYNKNSIKFINEDLNKKYKCEFRHAESKDGEFNIFDKVRGKSYYADAYSQELNLWIEIDESYHYKFGILNADDIIREKRIKEILNCKLIRIKWNIN